MRRNQRLFLLRAAALAAFLTISFGATPAAADPRVAREATDWAELIGPPPAPDSGEADEDLAILLWVQRTRSKSDVDRIWAAMSPGVGSFQQAIGTMLLPEQYPKLYGAVRDHLRASTPVFSALKSKWKRPRPATVDPRVKPCTPTPASGSYPSGTAMLGVVAGRLLADLIPQRQEAIRERADEIAELRVAAGVHFPTDVDAGSKLGEALADEILASPGWATRREALADELDELSRRLQGATTQ